MLVQKKDTKAEFFKKTLPELHQTAADEVPRKGAGSHLVQVDFPFLRETQTINAVHSLFS